MTHHFRLEPLWKYEPSLLVALANRAFADYFVPVKFTEMTFLNNLVVTGVSWDLSRVLVQAHDPVGFILIARRGWSVRIATMGLLPGYRQRGLGRQALEQILIEARQRGDRQVELEVITANEPAVRLYKKIGFSILQDLYSFQRPPGEVDIHAPLEEVDIRSVANRIAAAGHPNLPWQIAAETISYHSPPARALRLNGAFAVISDPEQSAITLHSLIVEPALRGKGLGRSLLGALFADNPGKHFHIPALCPARFEPLFISAGFERDVFSQHHMRLTL